MSNHLKLAMLTDLSASTVPSAPLVRRHDTLYMRDDSVIIRVRIPLLFYARSAYRYAVSQVEKTLYRFHRHFLTRRSKVFADMFELPIQPGQLVEGLTDEHPIFLENISCRDFERLLRLFYPE